jgi:branched-chain amino acid transport system substrate-binding protein
MRKWFSLLLALLILAAAIPLTSCSNSESEAKASYKIGAIVATSGGGSNLGIPEERTLKMMEEQINDAGGINGHPLEIILYDTESKADTCRERALRLVEEGVLAIIGPTTSGESTGIIDTAITPNKIPNVSLAAKIDIITPVAQRYWVFKTPQTEAQAVREIYKYLQSKDIHKVAIITDTSGYGAGGKKYLESEKDAYGIQLVDSQTFNTGDTSMQSQLTHINGTNPEAVVCWATDKESVVVAQDMKTLQMTMPLFCSHGVATKAFITAGGAAVEGVIIPAGKLLVANEIPSSDPQHDVLVKYKKDYEELYGEGTVDTFGGHAYDALSWITMALKQMDEDLSTADARQFIRDYIENDISDWPGTSGIYTLSPEDHLGMAPGSLLMYKIENGDWVWLK